MMVLLVRKLLFLLALSTAMLPWPAVAGAKPLRMGHGSLAQQDGGTTTVFYPTQSEEAPVSKGPFRLSWAEEGVPVAGNGRLVVISHGSGGSPWVHVDLARALVQHGFVVAVPQHAGDNYLDVSAPGPDSWKRRPLEVSLAIDQLEGHPVFSSLINFRAVGVFGGSAGGHTALTLAGGEWSPGRFRDHCLHHIEQDFSSCVGFTTLLHGNWLDGLKVWVAKQIIQWRFGDATPQRYTDPRIQAAVAMVPFAADFSLATLRSPVIPLGLAIAEQDINQVPEFHVKAVQHACQPRCEVIADIANGGHGMMLSPLPPLEVGSISHQLLSDTPTFDRAKVIPELNEAVAKFFIRKLLGS